MGGVTLDDLRRYAVARSLFSPTTLQGALDALGFVQADPIRAPARAQDLTLRHRVTGYRAGDLERLYPNLDLHEDVFVNYGFVTGGVLALMHPRGGPAPWTAARGRHVRAVLDFVRTHGPVHPRHVDQHFSLGTVTNYWGGSSSATTRLLEAMHYRGMLRVVRREAGIRIYAVHEHAPAPRPGARRARLDALVDVIVQKYAPLPASSLSALVRRLRYAVPQWTHELDHTLERTKKRLGRGRVDGIEWYWPAHEDPSLAAPQGTVRLLAPFDPIVWDRRRFEILWAWPYRFEAYTPVPKRRFGYYALPLLWRDRVIGWGNVSLTQRLHTDFGYVTGRAPRDREFRPALSDELRRLSAFLGLDTGVQKSAQPAPRSPKVA
ncbi:MAG TPA: crosslink repair DNA glycosylase YcaQ family protein [Vicinamibacterales bacterium]|nr:crosslink repair DNA glycosylase YcaQ family protein [Vicinamibacterales bacterium]